MFLSSSALVPIENISKKFGMNSLPLIKSTIQYFLRRLITWIKTDFYKFLYLLTEKQKSKTFLKISLNTKNFISISVLIHVSNLRELANFLCLSNEDVFKDTGVSYTLDIILMFLENGEKKHKRKTIWPFRVTGQN